MRTLTITLGLAALWSPLPAQQGAPARLPPATDQLAQARIHAAKENKRVLVAFCGDSPAGKQLTGILTTDPAFRRFLLYEYELVRADASADTDLAKACGLDLAKSGAPALAVLDSKGDKVATLLREQIGDPEAKDLIKALKPFQAPPLDAETVLADALAAAKK